MPNLPILIEETVHASACSRLWLHLSESIMFGVRNFVAFSFVALMATSCFGWQSGSRGGGGSSGGGGGGQSFSAPAQNFSAPAQNFSAPNQNFSGQSFGSFNGQLYGPTSPSFGSPQTGFSGSGSTFNQMPQTQQMPPMQSQMNGSGSGSSSPGIQESSLIDPVFEINDPNSRIVVDHSTWNHFLATYLTTGVRGINRINYRHVSFEDRQRLDCYLRQLQATDVRTLNRSEQLAYWFNLYNAKTVSLVLENYPLRSIRQIKQKFTDFVGPFDDEGAVRVNQVSLSLNDIESGIVRPIFNDPRIHYALNCASYGCPNLSPTAWTSQNIDARLNGAAYDYINSRRAVKRGFLGGTRVSKIYKWYKVDFGDNDAAVLNHMRQFAEGKSANIINRRNRISGYFYDWSLNDARINRRRILESVIR